MAKRLGLRGIALALMFVGWSGAERGAGQLQPASIAVLVYNRAHMRQETLRNGEEVVLLTLVPGKTRNAEKGKGS